MMEPGSVVPARLRDRIDEDTAQAVTPQEAVRRILLIVGFARMVLDNDPQFEEQLESTAVKGRVISA